MNRNQQLNLFQRGEDLPLFQVKPEPADKDRCYLCCRHCHQPIKDSNEIHELPCRVRVCRHCYLYRFLEGTACQDAAGVWQQCSECKENIP